MGVYIRNIDIPEIKRGVAAIINIDDIVFFKTADDIVLIPDHGDLIDRDELMKHGVYMPMDGGNLPLVYMSYVKGAKAVIPAERSEE